MKSHIYSFILGAVIASYLTLKVVDKPPTPTSSSTSSNLSLTTKKKKTTKPDGTVIEEEVQKVVDKKQENIEYKKPLNLFSASVSYSLEDSKLLYPLQYGRRIGNSDLHWSVGVHIDSKFAPKSIGAGIIYLF